MRINLPEANQNAKPEQVSQVIESAADSLHVLTESSTPHITVFEKRIGTRLVGGGAAAPWSVGVWCLLGLGNYGPQ